MTQQMTVEETVKFLDEQAKIQEEPEFDMSAFVRAETTIRSVNTTGLLEFITKVQQLISLVRLLQHEPRLSVAGAQERLDGVILDIQKTIMSKLFYEEKESLRDFLGEEDAKSTL